MNFEQRLNDVADKYRAQGYKVVVRPGPDKLPDFAKDFNVEIVALRDDGSVLASIKKGQLDLQADREVPRYAGIIENHPGWRFDVIVLESTIEPLPDRGEAKEPSDEDIQRTLGIAQRLVDAGFVQQALIAAWGVLETAMRRRLQAEGEEAGWGSSPRTMLNELYSCGVLDSSVFRDLESLFQARSAIVHGFATPAIEGKSVKFLMETARTLLEESQAAKMTA